MMSEAFVKRSEMQALQEKVNAQQVDMLKLKLQQMTEKFEASQALIFNMATGAMPNLPPPAMMPMVPPAATMPQIPILPTALPAQPSTTEKFF